MDRRIAVLFAALLMAVALVGCSQVFEAGISGTVVTKDGTRDVAVPNVNVFAYTDKSLRDSDLEKFKAGKRTRPSEGSGYVATTTTNAQGQFVVNKIVWETTKSEFGKTADVNKLYLIIYHEDYVPASYDATIISGSTNADNVYVTLEGSKDYTTVTVRVLDVSTEREMGSAATLSYWVNSETTTEPDTVVVTGNTTFQISYEKGSTATLKMFLDSDGTYWTMTNSEGKKVDEPQSFSADTATKTVTLYMRNDEITLPAFSGDIDGSVTDAPNNAKDNLPIRLGYKDKNGAAKYFTQVDEAQEKTYCRTYDIAGEVKYQHGLFSNVGNSDNYSIVINRDTFPEIIDWDAFDDKTISLTLRIYFNGTPYEFEYTPRTNPNLGHITI